MRLGVENSSSLIKRIVLLTCSACAVYANRVLTLPVMFELTRCIYTVA